MGSALVYSRGTGEMRHLLAASTESHVITMFIIELCQSEAWCPNELSPNEVNSASLDVKRKAYTKTCVKCNFEAIS